MLKIRQFVFGIVTVSFSLLVCASCGDGKQEPTSVISAKSQSGRSKRAAFGLVGGWVERTWSSGRDHMFLDILTTVTRPTSKGTPEVLFSGRKTWYVGEFNDRGGPGAQALERGSGYSSLPTWFAWRDLGPSRFRGQHGDKMECVISLFTVREGTELEKLGGRALQVLDVQLAKAFSEGGMIQKVGAVAAEIASGKVQTAISKANSDVRLAAIFTAVAYHNESGVLSISIGTTFGCAARPGSHKNDANWDQYDFTVRGAHAGQNPPRPEYWLYFRQTK